MYYFNNMDPWILICNLKLKNSVTCFFFNFIAITLTSKSHVSTAGIATGYQVEDQGVGIRILVKTGIFSTSSRLALGLAQPPIEWVPGAFPQG
jgi:hypothetical protein